MSKSKGIENDIPANANFKISCSGYISIRIKWSFRRNCIIMNKKGIL